MDDPLRYRVIYLARSGDHIHGYLMSCAAGTGRRHLADQALYGEHNQLMLFMADPWNEKAGSKEFDQTRWRLY